MKKVLELGDLRNADCKPDFLELFQVNRYGEATRKHCLVHTMLLGINVCNSLTSCYYQAIGVVETIRHLLLTFAYEYSSVRDPYNPTDPTPHGPPLIIHRLASTSRELERTIPRLK